MFLVFSWPDTLATGGAVPEGPREPSCRSKMCLVEASGGAVVCCPGVPVSR